MSISILNRGASGGLKPELTVTAPVGSTIDLIQNSIIVATYTLGAEEVSHTFVVKIGTYTVKATLGADTSETEVAVDAVGQYAIEMSYKVWLFNHGDVTEITGGWTAVGTNDGGSTTGVTEVSDILYATATGTSGQNGGRAGLRTNNIIDFSGYTKLCFHVVSVVYPGTQQLQQGYYCKVGADDFTGKWYDNTLYAYAFTSAATDTIIKTDVSQATNCYAYLCGTIGYNAITVNQIWLE